ncbi:acyl-CoA thioesterase [Frankia gtarii]|uniref:acyl-CoA thioesterase n=1 Tax=Frankia gtarii TaxID=2950102 RepID=UPI0021C19C64|nr:thioesterase family protein [Frankia gtarii]
MLRYMLPVTHRPDRDGVVSQHRHVPFFLALEIAAQAWARALATTCEGLLAPADLAVVDVASTYRRELFTGDVLFEVALSKFGSSSLTFALELTQHDHPAASLTATLVKVDADRLHSMPFTPEQRAALDRLLLV